MRRHQCPPDPVARVRRSERGLTLIELLIGAALGVLMLAAAAAVLLAAGRMQRNQQLLSDANEEARTALRHVARAMSSAGAGGGVFSFMDATGARQQRPAVLFTNGAVALHEPTMPQKPDSLTLLRYAADRRSVLVGALTPHVLSVAPDGRQPTTPGVQRDVFLNGESALVTNFQRAMLVTFTRKTLNGALRSVDLDVGANDPTALQDSQIPIEPGATVFPVQVIRYRVVYVPPAGTAAERADLVMETLDPRTLAPLQQTVLARNVEDFQVQWAYDRNDDGVADGSGANAYTDEGPTGPVLDPGLSFARVSLSARTSNTLVNDKGAFVTNEDTPFERGIDLDSAGTRPPSSGYRRRVLSTVVLLKNLVAPRI
ncbi:prepilin-type N-terminal cleavage/methylation domain-containing protein [Vitiosangium sp. GDMCC 1.1324]|uniref:prepilin-type N-terminal cleavage/methylation domain-containing protein n=1 Tax=Vitiosangium sp. (strain GDMCC 1.1324) TaxID=2138576 RepID=UPI000D36AF4D|nr:prepilin-type N-terminal cleavage/methylation domain-containing protein [Vitiosangium sp. GDMCC 1.1324]PTL77427.1 hypothetical protein DAT35_44285 [Vitiosangium sp. GDMCC 1.1324]